LAPVIRLPLTFAAALATLFVLLSGSPGTSAFAQGSGDHAVVNQDLTIQKDETVEGDVSVTGGNLIVYGQVQGEVVVIHGNADVEGSVDGDVSVTDGNITLGPDSSVAGDVQALLGRVDRDPGAKVEGDIRAPSLNLSGISNDVVIAPVAPGKLNVKPASSQLSTQPASFFDRVIDFFGKGLVSLLFLVLGMVVVGLQPKRVQIASMTLESEPGPSLVVGAILALLLFPVAIVLSFALFVSIVGIIFIPVLWFLVGVGVLLGFVTVSGWLGRLIFDANHPTSALTNHRVMLDVVLGMAVVLGATFIPSVLAGSGVTVLMVLLIYFASSVGLGAVILSRVGTLVPPRHASHFHRIAPHYTSSPAMPQMPPGPAQTTEQSVAVAPGPNPETNS